MPVPPSPHDEPVKPADAADEDEGAQRTDPVASDAGVVNEFDTPEEQENTLEMDLEAIESVVTHDDEATLVASKIIPAERGYTLEQLKNNDEAAWTKACEHYLKIAVYKYRDVVSFYLPGVDEEDAKSAVASIVPDLANKIEKYLSLTQLDKAFRKALVRDIWSLQRKFLAKKRGAGKVDVTSELDGLEQEDKPLDQKSWQDEDEAAKKSSLEKKINPEYVDWSAHQNTGAAASANRSDQQRLMGEAMEELDPNESEMVRLSVIGGLKQREIAERMAKNPKQIGSELNRAKAKLKKALNEKLLREKLNLL